jgi:hypothetical protein
LGIIYGEFGTHISTFKNSLSTILSAFDKSIKLGDTASESVLLPRILHKFEI